MKSRYKTVAWNICAAACSTARASGAARGEGGLSGRQLKNAAAEPPNRYDARHVPATATNSRARAAAGRRGGAPRGAALSADRQYTRSIARDGRTPRALPTIRVSPKTGPMHRDML